MESYAHSHSRPPISAPPFSKNSYNVNSHRNATGFTAYDAVFGGPPRFAAGPGGALSPRAEEYGEIFNGFNLRASSSIPVLDLPAVDDDVASFDPARSRFDYSEVFGGFGNVEFVPFDELFRQSDGGDGCSDEEVWTPAGTESFSDESDPWACSEKDQRLPNGNAQQSYDSKQYNVSYHEVGPSARENTDNLTHVAQLNAVRGYSYVVDEAKSLHKVEEEIFCAQVADDIILSMDSFGNVTQENNMRKAASRISDGDSHSSDNNHRQGKACGSSGVHPNSTSNSASDINLRMEPSHLPLPSRPPLVSTDGTEDSGKLNSDYKASKTYDFELAVDGGSSPFFDVEVNASSSAVASAAAMKEAMDKAQLKLKSAKELMARRKDGHQKSPKMALNNDEGVMKVASASCSLMDNRLQAACEVEHVELKNPDKERPGAASARQLCHEQPTNLTEKLSQRNQVKKSSLSPDHVSIEEAGKWKKEMQYYEFVTAESSIASPQPNNGNNLAQKENSSQPSSINGMTEALKGQEDSDEGDLNSAGEAHELEDNRPRLKATKSASRRGFHEKMVKVAQEVHERVVCEHAETEKRLNNTCERNENDIKPKSYCRQDDIELDQSSQAVDRRKPREAVPDKAAETMLKDTLCREANKKKEGKAPQTEENGNRIKEAYEKRMKEAHERDKEESTIAEEQERESKERRKKEAFANHENEQRLKEASYGHENYKSEEAYKQNEDRGSGDKDKKRLMEAAEKELGGEKILEVCEIQETEKMNEVQQREEYETRLGEVVLQEKPEEIIVEVGLEDCKKHDEAVGTMKTKKCMHVEDELNQKEVQESDGKIEKVLEEEQMEKKSVLVSEKGESRMELENEGEGERWKAVPNTSRQVEWGNKNEKPYSTPGINMHMEDECLKASDEVCDLEVEDLTQTLPNENEEPHRKTKANKEVIGPKENGNIGVKPVVDQEKSKASEPTKVLIEEKPAECKMHGPRTESSSKSLPRNDENLKRRGMLEQNKEVPVIVSCSKDPRRFNHELGGRSMDVGEGMVFFDPGKDKDNSTPSAGENGTEHMKKTEAACPVMLQRNWSTEKRSQMPNKNQTIERNGKTINNNRSMEEKEREKEERLKRERELEEHLRKLEEEREREREREKDRIAVEIATREARDKAAFDRAIAESRQRAMAESRERLERACAEARERSSVQKSSNEARLRAEPAAVERATAEARERVIEKAMAERAASEARERIQRSMSDNFSSCSRGADMRKSFLYSSSAKFESTEVEPVQRCTARLERHRRTVERVAKALEEKNMRDLLAQREQAERNRLAEMLDADIRRWLSGKEGNLRALLSTLQYILGPESGWTPIPLTEVITTAAVKKAYRKATLCVHPDKLQQRGASIQQKYICEKVFDLLKEAWNKFNSEER